jgi:IMP dehydrogenase
MLPHQLHRKELITKGITFSDVLIKPNYSEVDPSQVEFKTKLSKNIELDIPLISAAMDTVTNAKMAITIGKLGGAGVIHRNQTAEEQAKELEQVSEKGLLSIGSIGFFGESFDRGLRLLDAGAKAIIIDTAHGDTKLVVDMVKKLKSDSRFSAVDVIAGNIATGSAAKRLIDAGVDGLKVGIGPGSICTTRIVTGVGVPQVSAIIEVAENSSVPVIADGGVEYSGDLAKAIIAGADSIMIGSLLAATSDSPGELINIDGQEFKKYRGMGSLGVLGRKDSHSKDRYFSDEVSKPIPEGIEGVLKYNGETTDLIKTMLGGLRQSMFYTGANTIPELQSKGEFIQISSSGLNESHPHNLYSFERTINY